MKQTVIFVLLAILSIKCSGDSDILVQSDVGVVTRGDLNTFLDVTKQKSESQDPEMSKAIQAKSLESLAIVAIISRETQKRGLVSPSELNTLKDYFFHSLSLNLYLEDFRQAVSLETPLEFYEIQVASLKGMDPSDLQTKGKKLENEINELSSSKVEAFLSQITDEVSRKPVGGYLEPICMSCPKKPLEEELEKAKVLPRGKFGFFAEEGSEIGYLIRVNKTEKVHPKRLTSYFERHFEFLKTKATDYLATNNNNPQTETGQSLLYYSQIEPSSIAKQYAEEYLRQSDSGLVNKELESLRNESGISIAEGVREDYFLLQQNPNLKVEEIFPDERKLLQNENITVGVIRESLNKIPIALQGRKDGQTVSTREVLEFFNGFWQSYYISTKSKTIQNRKPPKRLQFLLDFQLSSVLSSLWQRDITNRIKDPSETELLNEYEIGKLYAYSKADPNNPQERKPIPFPIVREQIQKTLRDRALQTQIKDQLTALKATYNFRLNEAEL